MDPKDLSIAELEAQGITHVEVRCKCRIVAIPFRMLHAEKRISPETKFSDMASRLRCSKCKELPVSVVSWNVERASSRATGAGPTSWMMPPMVKMRKD